MLALHHLDTLLAGMTMVSNNVKIMKAKISGTFVRYARGAKLSRRKLSIRKLELFPPIFFLHLSLFSEHLGTSGFSPAFKLGKIGYIFLMIALMFLLKTVSKNTQMYSSNYAHIDFPLDGLV